jgi:hypothetical protein
MRGLDDLVPKAKCSTSASPMPGLVDQREANTRWHRGGGRIHRVAIEYSDQANRGAGG